MKFSKTSLAALAALTRCIFAAPSVSPLEAPSTSGTLFTIDGVTGYFAGTNCYWCGFLTNDDDVDLVMSHLEESGLRILRVWGFNDVNTKPGDSTVWYQYLASNRSEINTGANGLQRLDKVVSSAGEHGVKLIINFVNNWDDYGGISAYTNVFGGTHQEWFTNDAAQAQYRAYVKAVVGRYADSDAVLAWELGNEPRCNGCDTDVIFDWAKATSAYVKSLDSTHLVTLGDEGFGIDGAGNGEYPYTFAEGVDFEKNLQIETLDFGTFHFYPGSWSVGNDFGTEWVESHASLCVAAGKPCFFEEYGVTSDKCNIERPWQQVSVQTEGMAGDAFWQLGDTLSTGPSADDGNTIYYGTEDWTCLITEHVAEI